MPRRNRQRDSYEPLDLTPADIAADVRAVKRQKLTPEQFAAHKKRAALRQADARINRGIDWSVCLVPGCGTELTLKPRAEFGPADRDHRTRLPLCLYHGAVAHSQVFPLRDEPLMVNAAALLLAYKRQEIADLEASAAEAFMRRQDGDIYFVRLNGMVKVGWTRDLSSRLKAYGASVEVLAHHPGTRDDETNLHRQLRPALARGREWYEDGPIIQDYIASVVERWGEPHKSAVWTEPKQPAARMRPRR